MSCGGVGHVRSDPNKQAAQSVTAREHFVFTDQDGLLYHFIVEGNLIKDGSKIPPDVRLYTDCSFPSFSFPCFPSVCWQRSGDRSL